MKIRKGLQMFSSKNYLRYFSSNSTEKMNFVGSINDAIRIALKTDDTAVVFGEVILSLFLLLLLFLI